jgi:hypothetical protein
MIKGSGIQQSTKTTWQWPRYAVDSKATELSRKDEIHANIAVMWKREALDGMKEAFASKGEQRRQPRSWHEDPSGKD